MAFSLNSFTIEFTYDYVKLFMILYFAKQKFSCEKIVGAYNVTIYVFQIIMK